MKRSSCLVVSNYYTAVQDKIGTIFGQLLSLIRRPEFNRLCRKHEADKYSKGFSAWNELSELQPAAKKAAEQTLYAVDATTIGLCINDFPPG